MVKPSTSTSCLEKQVYSACFTSKLKYELKEWPVIWVGIGQFQHLALLDTGSARSYMLTELFKATGIDKRVDDGDEVFVNGIFGLGTGYLHEVPVIIGNHEPMNCPMVFIDKLPLGEKVPIILGRECIFQSLGPILFYERPGGGSVFLT